MAKIFLFVVLIGLIFLGRIIDHPANFAPVSAVALVATVYLGKNWGWSTAAAGMVLGDLLIGFYDWRLMLAVYGSFLLISLMGLFLKKTSDWTEIIGVSILASLIFFFITNAAVWWLTPAYPADLTGLAQAYLMGLPFLRNTLMGDMLFTTVLFALAKQTVSLLDKSVQLVYNAKV